MKGTQIQGNIEFDEGVLPALRKTPEPFADEIRFLVAAK
jgi:hypothetical protein